MSYEINIKEFSGPLDLLLHLVKQSNIDIMNINIDQITQQYLDYIKKMEDLNLNIASEYLVMAAELIQIKSSSLLPKDESNEDDDEENTKEKLIKRLLEYEQYKNLISEFKNLEEFRHEVYTKEPSTLTEYQDNIDKQDYGITLDDLVNAFNKFLCEKSLEKPLNTKISSKEYSITKRSFEIRNILRKKKKINFLELFETFNKEYVVVTFLSILSMVRKQEIEIEQSKNFNDIIIKEKGV